MIRTPLCASAALAVSMSLVFSCSSQSAQMDRAADAPMADVQAPDPQIDDAADTLTSAVDPTGDAGSSSLDWFPGNYGLTDTTNTAARDAFLTGLSNAFDGVQLIYLWTACESGTVMGDYSACFAAIDADLAAAELANKHIILMLQYKQFGAGVDAVPAYLRGPGPWCETSGGTQTCGQYSTPNAAIAMIWNSAVAARLQAWIAALGAYYGPGGQGAAHANRIAGIVLPETSTGGNGTGAGYTPAKYVAAIEANLLAITTAFPTKPAFQYINFLPPAGPSQVAALKSIADFALLHPHVGLGCPDVGGNSTFHPPGYDTLMNATYQHHLPFNVAIEPMDYTSPYTAGLPQTYAEATAAAPNGMAAQFVVWWHMQAAADVFKIDDVAAYLPTHPNPNVLPPY